MKLHRRWRVILPFAAVLALIAITVGAHVIEQPDPGDTSFLSPVSDEGDGARRLADELTRQGVRIEVRSSTLEAVDAVSVRGSTVLVTAPALLAPGGLEMLTELPPESRVVVVAPDATDLAGAGLDVEVDGPRWTAAAPGPGCDAPFAGAGPAAVERLRYDAAGYEPLRCYAGGVVQFRNGNFAEVTLVGAADPFRNDRAGEHGNQALALALLSGRDRVIWLDLHERERVPPPSAEPTSPVDPDAPVLGGPADPEGDYRNPQPAPEPGGDPDAETSADQAGGSPPEEPNPLIDGFPAAMWAAIAVLVLAAIALAAASARRLGAPVAEPLPARVRTAETVRGLGGLYRRARARSTSLQTVQAAARRRLAGHFGLPPDVPADVLARHVAAAAGRPEDEVRHVLGGGAEDSDEELARAATEVQRLVRAATGTQPHQRALDEGNV